VNKTSNWKLKEWPWKRVPEFPTRFFSGRNPECHRWDSHAHVPMITQVCSYVCTVEWPDWANFRPLRGFLVGYVVFLITELAQIFWITFFTAHQLCYVFILTKMGWATFWPKTHLVTLVYREARRMRK
jgi:hypothetical protein